MDLQLDSKYIKKWFERNRYRFYRGGLWLLEGEIGFENEINFQDAMLRILLVRLSTYHNVVNSYTFSLLKELSKRVDGVYIDFAFMPPIKDLNLMIKENIPLLIGKNSKEPGVNFDLIGISNSIIQELINLPILLYYTGINFNVNERLKDENIPIIILGGANASLTKCLVSMDKKESFVDAIFYGEAEEGFPKILEILKEKKLKGYNKEKILTECEEKVEGFKFIKSEKVVRVVRVKDNKYFGIIKQPIIWFDKDSANKVNIEISKGCPFWCSFCRENYEHKPYREAPIEILIEQAKEIRKNSGAKMAILSSYNFNSYSKLPTLLEKMTKIFPLISLKSERLDIIVKFPQLLNIQHKIGKTSLTISIEGISERLRNYLNKEICEEDILKGFDYIFKSKVRSIKIFLLATGLENDSDFEEFRKLIKKISELKIKNNSKVNLIFSLGALIRFPNTPLFYDKSINNVQFYKKFIKKIKQIINPFGFKVRLSMNEYDYLVGQILSRSQSELYPVLKELSLNKILYYENFSKFHFDNLKKLLNKYNIAMEKYFSKGSDEYKDIDFGVSKEFLKYVYNKNKKYQQILTCVRIKEDKVYCLNCGACDNKKEKYFLINFNYEKKSSFDLKKWKNISYGKIWVYFPFNWEVIPVEIAENYVNLKVINIDDNFLYKFNTSEITKPFDSIRSAGWKLFNLTWDDIQDVKISKLKLLQKKNRNLIFGKIEEDFNLKGFLLWIFKIELVNSELIEELIEFIHYWMRNERQKFIFEKGKNLLKWRISKKGIKKGINIFLNINSGIAYMVIMSSKDSKILLEINKFIIEANKKGIFIRSKLDAIYKRLRENCEVCGNFLYERVISLSGYKTKICSNFHSLI